MSYRDGSAGLVFNCIELVLVLIIYLEHTVDKISRLSSSSHDDAKA